MSKRLLVLNMEVSGMNKYLFAQLRKRGWELNVIDVPYPKRCRYWAMASTFNPVIKKWKKDFDRKINKLHKTSWVFRKRSQFCVQKIKESLGQFDEILQIAGTFSPFDPKKFLNSSINTNINKYFLVISYTMALSKGFDGWEPYENEYGKWFAVEKLLYQKAEKILTTNDNVRKSLIKDYGIIPEKIIKIGYGSTLEKLPDEEKVYDGKTALFIGMDFERKGGFVLLEAFKKVRQAIAGARLVIVGPNKELININEPGVELLGHVSDREKIEKLYKEASLFVMPSLMEPFGLVFLEAMAHKIPCIGTTVDAMPEIIEDGKTGFLVAPKNVEELAAKMILSLSNQKNLKEMGQAAFEKLQREFSWDFVGEKVDKALSPSDEREKWLSKKI